MPEDAPSVDSMDIRWRTPWTRKQNVGRILWWIAYATVFRLSPHNAYAWRAMVLRTFGAKIGRHVQIRRTARVEIPWHLEIGEHSRVGDFAILYSLGRISIGRYVTVSQYAHLCAGTHETRSRAMPLICPPIVLGDDVWVAADAFVGPGVAIGARTILGARASVFKDLPPDVVAVGNPARPIKAREFGPEAESERQL